MNLQDTLDNFHQALNDFVVSTNERILLENNLSERCIAHKFAEYLKGNFEDFIVDCEYNRNIDIEKSFISKKKSLGQSLGKKLMTMIHILFSQT